jgi:hypothetical protein
MAARCRVRQRNARNDTVSVTADGCPSKCRAEIGPDFRVCFWRGRRGPARSASIFSPIFLNRAARSSYTASSASIIRDAASHKIQMQAPIALQTERLTFTRRGSLPRHYTLQAGCNCQPPGLSELKGHSDKPISHRGVCELFRFEDPGDANSPVIAGESTYGRRKAQQQAEGNSGCPDHQSAPQSPIKDRSVKIVSAETTSEIAAKTTLGWPLLVAATLINSMRRRVVISAKCWR